MTMGNDRALFTRAYRCSTLRKDRLGAIGVEVVGLWWGRRYGGRDAAPSAGVVRLGDGGGSDGGGSDGGGRIRGRGCLRRWSGELVRVLRLERLGVAH